MARLPHINVVSEAVRERVAVIASGMVHDAKAARRAKRQAGHLWQTQIVQLACSIVKQHKATGAGYPLDWLKRLRVAWFAADPALFATTTRDMESGALASWLTGALGDISAGRDS